jgi:hypothetical protein
MMKLLADLRRLVGAPTRPVAQPRAERTTADMVPGPRSPEPPPSQRSDESESDSADAVSSPAAESPASGIEVVMVDPVPVAEAPEPVHAATTGEVVDAPSPVPAKAGGLTLRLETERGPAPTFEVSKSGATIGRGQENTIRLEDLSVSRRHARIAYRQGGYWLSDLGSMGGTWVDGTRLNAARRILAGQTIDIGVCRLTVGLVAEGDGAAKEAGPASRPGIAAEGGRRR